MAIVHYDMQLKRLTYEVMQILSISLTDKTNLRDHLIRLFSTMSKNLIIPFFRDYLINVSIFYWTLMYYYSKKCHCYIHYQMQVHNEHSKNDRITNNNTKLIIYSRLQNRSYENTYNSQ